MITRILRNIHNTAVKLAVGILAVASMYVGGAALLAASIGAHLVIVPLAAHYVPESADFRVLTLLWLAFALAAMLGIGAVLAHPMAWLLNRFDALQDRLSFA